MKKFWAATELDSIFRTVNNWFLGSSDVDLENWLPQVVLFGLDSKPDQDQDGFCKWLPGRKGTNIADYKYMQYARHIAFTGRYYNYNVKDVTMQDSCVVAAAMVDIDDYIDHEKINEVLKGVGTIRRSKYSGLHIILRFKNPVQIPECFNGSIVQESLRPYVEKLKTICPVNICKWHGGSFDLFTKGGNQETVFKSDATIPFIKPREQRSHLGFFQSPRQEIITENMFNYKPLKLIKLLQSKGCLPSFPFCRHTDIYIKKWYEVLKGTEWEFKTKSPMQSKEEHVNGWCFFDGIYLKLYACADNHVNLKKIVFKKPI